MAIFIQGGIIKYIKETTLKDAINLYEEEKFREELLISIENLSKYVDNLATTMVIGMNVIIDTNMKIYGQLKEINITNKANLYNDLLDDILK